MKANSIFRFLCVLLFASLFNGCGGGSNGATSAPTTSGIAQIQLTLNNFVSCLLQGCSTASNYLAPTFLMDGMNAGSYLGLFGGATPLISKGDYILLTLANRFDDPTTQNNNSADLQWVNLTQYNSTGKIIGQSRVKFVNNGTHWLLAGNERTVLVNVRAESGLVAAASGVPANFSSAINISIDPVSASRAGIASAWVSGTDIVTALPAAIAVIAYNNPAPNAPASAVQANLLLPVCSTSIAGNCAKPVDGTEFTIKLVDFSGKQVASYLEVLNKAPVVNSVLTASEFPTVTSVSISNSSGNSITLAQATQQSITTVNWNLPLGSNNTPKLAVNWVDFKIWDTNGLLVCQLSGVPTGNSFSANFQNCSLPDPANPDIFLSKFQVTLQATDDYGRQYILFQ
jgi:hypothetical protein